MELKEKYVRLAVSGNLSQIFLWTRHMVRRKEEDIAGVKNVTELNHKKRDSPRGAQEGQPPIINGYIRSYY